MESVVRKADVVVRAQIVGKESQLTRSAEDVVTYYRFLPIKAFKDTIGITPARQTPQMTFPLVYFEMGGVVEVDGLEIHQSVSDMADPPVTVGEDVLLFLTWDKDKNAFRRQNGPFGLLRIHGDTVAEARKTIKRNLAGKRASEVEAEIERLVAGVPRR